MENRLNKEIEYSAKHIALTSEDGWKHDLWSVTIAGQSVEFKTGMGLRKTIRRTGRQKETVPVAPSIDDVIYSLVMDADCASESFDDFCANCGYDTDSRKALETYLACQESGHKLRKMGINLEEAREAYQDY